MENTNIGSFTKKVSISFMEREPQFIENINPYVAAKFYKDLADSDFSLYTKKDYQQLYKLLTSVSLYCGCIEKTEKHAYTINFVFGFSSRGNFEEFIEDLQQSNKNISSIN